MENCKKDMLNRAIYYMRKYHKSRLGHICNFTIPENVLKKDYPLLI